MRDLGFDRVWTVQLPWEHDALTTLAVGLREVDGLTIGTGVQQRRDHDVAKARELAAEAHALYGTLPSYRAMLDREGVTDPADVALIGDEDAVGARIEEIRAAGVTEFGTHVFGPADEDRDRTRAFLRAA